MHGATPPCWKGDNTQGEGWRIGKSLPAELAHLARLADAARAGNVQQWGRGGASIESRTPARFQGALCKTSPAHGARAGTL